MESKDDKKLYCAKEKCFNWVIPPVHYCLQHDLDETEFDIMTERTIKESLLFLDEDNTKENSPVKKKKGILRLTKLVK